jgi:hypothetical protein
MSSVFRSWGNFVQHLEGEDGLRRSNYSYFGTEPKTRQFPSLPFQKRKQEDGVYANTK